MNYQDKKELYERIMLDVARRVKRRINEDFLDGEDVRDTRGSAAKALDQAIMDEFREKSAGKDFLEMNKMAEVISYPFLVRDDIEELLKRHKWKLCDDMMERCSAKTGNVEAFYYQGRKGSKYYLIQVLYPAGSDGSTHPLAVVRLNVGGVRY